MEQVGQWEFGLFLQFAGNGVRHLSILDGLANCAHERANEWLDYRHCDPSRHLDENYAELAPDPWSHFRHLGRPYANNA